MLNCPLARAYFGHFHKLLMNLVLSMDTFAPESISISVSLPPIMQRTYLRSSLGREGWVTVEISDLLQSYPAHPGVILERLSVCRRCEIVCRICWRFLLWQGRDCHCWVHFRNGNTCHFCHESFSAKDFCEGMRIGKDVENCALKVLC